MRVESSNTPNYCIPARTPAKMKEFGDVTRYIDVEPFLNGPVPALEFSDWSSIIDAYKYDPDNLAIAALKAFHLGGISTEQFSTALFLYDLLKTPNQTVHVKPLFDENGALYPEAENILRQTFESKGNVNRGNSPILSSESFDEYVNLMRNSDQSEQTFFYIKNVKTENSVTDRIVESTGMNALNYFKEGDVDYRMVPSFSMMHSFLYAYGDEETVIKMTPVIGLSTVEDIAFGGKNRSRDLALPFIGVELPKMADGFAAPSYVDFRFHDFYHAVLLSGVPDKFKRASMELADLVNSFGSSTYLDPFYEKLVDMEHLFFRKNASNTLPVASPTNTQKFIWWVAQAQRNILLSVSSTDRDEVSVTVQKIAIKILNNGFCEKYGIIKGEIQDLMDGARGELIAGIGKKRAELMIKKFKPLDLWSALLERL